MGRWEIVLAAVTLLGLATQLRAQTPTGGNGLRFVPIDTTKNLATPIPTVNIPQPNLSMQDKVHNFFARFLPFINKRQGTLPGPVMPGTTLPKGIQSAINQPQKPTTSTSTSGLPSLPTVPPIVSGSVR
jgi:hypothetical protein